MQKLKMNNRGNAFTDTMVAVGIGIVTLALIVGIGVLVLGEFGDASGDSDVTNVTSYLVGQLGEGGLSGWVPAVIAISIGLLFLGAFLSRKGRAF